MSLREELAKAAKDVQQDRIATDLKNINTLLNGFADKVRPMVAYFAAKTRVGFDITQDEKNALRTSMNCPAVTLTDLRQDVLESLQGYRRLHEICRSGDTDVQLKVDIYPTGNVDRKSNKLAGIIFAVDPFQAFSTSTITINLGQPNVTPCPMAITKPLPPAIGEEVPVFMAAKFNL